jgi:hypothetical protein
MDRDGHGILHKLDVLDGSMPWLSAKQTGDRRIEATRCHDDCSTAWFICRKSILLCAKVKFFCAVQKRTPLPDCNNYDKSASTGGTIIDQATGAAEAVFLSPFSEGPGAIGRHRRMFSKLGSSDIISSPVQLGGLMLNAS